MKSVLPSIPYDIISNISTIFLVYEDKGIFSSQKYTYMGFLHVKIETISVLETIYFMNFDFSFVGDFFTSRLGNICLTFNFRDI